MILILREGRGAYPESPALPDEDPVLRRQVHGVALLHAVGLMELVKLLHNDVGPQIRQGMGVVTQNVKLPTHAQGNISTKLFYLSRW